MTQTRELIDLRTELQVIERQRKALVDAALTTIRGYVNEAKTWTHPQDREDRIEEIHDAIHESGIRQALGGDVWIYETEKDIRVEFEEWQTSHC